jgi:hypothetical protein
MAFVRNTFGGASLCPFLWEPKKFGELYQKARVIVFRLVAKELPAQAVKQSDSANSGH